jgi:D-alanyl-D-alanine carboxypeptidase/D-alanyl-D-alanine-endopeptidase (penicillin-binding protein 4)
MKTKYLIAFIITFISYNTLSAQNIQDSARKKVKIASKQSITSLRKDIDALLDSPEISGASVGVSVISLESGESFYKKNDTKNFPPASTLKLLTSADALESLGAEYKFATRLYMNGSIKEDGEYVGDLIIRAGGDPSISKNFYKDPMAIIDRFAATLDSLGIKSINGNIIGDDNFFDDEYYGPGWAWDDLAYPFSAEINALSAFDNKVDIIVTPGKSANQLAEFYMEPRNNYLQIDNRVRTVLPEKVSDLSIYRAPYTNVVKLDGFILKDSTNKERNSVASVSIDNPTLFFLSLIKDCIETRNIKFRGALIDIDDYKGRIAYNELKQISEIISPPIKDIIKVLNKQSNNLIAEALLKTISKENSGKGSFNKGAEILTKFANKIGIKSDNLAIVDGSGLSRLNLISPNGITSVLAYMFKNEYKGEYVGSLAAPGEDGTLKKRMTKSVAQKNLNAKSGSMNNVNNLAGYVKTKDGENLAFSIMIANHTAPQNVVTNIIDLICMRLAAYNNN